MRQLSELSRAARLGGAALAVFLSALAFTANAQAQAGRSATRVWVSAATGSDTNPCTRAAPCRDLSSAVSAVAEGGEVVILDSGGYDAVEITKSVQIVAPEGVHAVIAPTTGIAVPGDAEGSMAAVLVNAPGAKVVLRNITINGNGTVNRAIRATAVASLSVENCVLNVTNNLEDGDTFYMGLSFAASGRLAVRDTTVRNQDTGILITAPPGGTAYASIDGCRLDGNPTGLFASANSRVVVSNTVAANAGGGAGFLVSTSQNGPTAELSCDNCTASDFYFGFRNNGGAGAVMRVARSVATSNHYGFFNSLNGSFRSLTRTNLVEGNEVNRSGTIVTISGDTQ
jgi:hypothetical protein